MGTESTLEIKRYALCPLLGKGQDVCKALSDNEEREVTVPNAVIQILKIFVLILSSERDLQWYLELLSTAIKTGATTSCNPQHDIQQSASYSQFSYPEQESKVS